jgi:hypothetical protein
LICCIQAGLDILHSTQTKPTLSANLHQSSITSPVSTTPAAATPPPTPTARRMHCETCQLWVTKITAPVFKGEDQRTRGRTHPTNPRPTNSPNSRQQRRPHIPTIQQNLQRRHIVNNHRPRHSARAARQVVIPHQQQQREQFSETRHQQRRADQRFVRVVRDDAAR